jgi:hypothetical protein
MIKRVLKYRLFTFILLLVCLLMTTSNLFARPSINNCLPPDTVKTAKQQKPIVQKPKQRVRFTATDSIDDGNKVKKHKMNKVTVVGDSLKFDSLSMNMKKIFNPNPIKATWLAMIFPGGGQIYNRKYWKLPIVYGGLAGCAYALSWNNKMYKDYAQGYRDIMDDNPNTNSYKDLLPAGANYSTSQLTSILKKRKDLYRRYRDMSIFSVIGVYLISIVDAYVDAELSNFDISPDLSLRVDPVIINNKNFISQDKKALGIQCSLKF